MPKIDWISIFFEEKSAKNRNWLTTPYMGGCKPEYFAYIHLTIQIILAVFTLLLTMTMTMNCSGRLPVPLSTIEHSPLARHTTQSLEEIRVIVGTTVIEGAFKAIYGVMGIAMAVGLPLAVIGMKERRPALLLPIILFNLLQSFAILSVCFALFFSGITTANIFVIPSLIMTAVAVCYYLHSMRVFMRVHEDFWKEEEEMENELDNILEEQMKGMVERKEALVGPDQ